ncbi:hypothetical protein VNO77_16218 [Canavalia gladiata]|uniref:Uncharacterized protein n=1 Tax=Canavalia gladiata TaxID=3824 RepID=A0AAN9M1C6_CANGL
MDVAWRGGASQRINEGCRRRCFGEECEMIVEHIRRGSHELHGWLRSTSLGNHSAYRVNGRVPGVGPQGSCGSQ